MKGISISKYWSLGLVLWVSACYYSEDIPRTGSAAQCEGSTLSVSATSQNATGCGTSDGAITASASGGVSPYSFSLNGGTKQNNGTFTGLKGGTYVVTVFDATLCTSMNEITVATNGTSFSVDIKTVTPDTDCFGQNGSVELIASGGKTPYQYSIGSGFGSSAIFNNLAGGTYNATARDADQCELSLGVVIPNGISTSYDLVIKPIFEAKCNFQTCHGAGTGRRDYTKFENVKAAATEIKRRTSNGTMPKNPKPGGSLSADQIARIACWVDEGANNN